MSELDRESQLRRMWECVRLAEQACSEMYEARQPAGPYSDVKEFYADAIGLAHRLGLRDEAGRFEKRLADIKAVFRGQMSGGGPSTEMASVRIWPPTLTPDADFDKTRRLIHQNAAHVLELGFALTTFGFTYDSQTVRWLDGLIDHLRTRTGAITKMEDPKYEYDLWARSWRVDDQADQVSYLGAFLGEVIIDNYGGQWDCDDHGWHVRFDEKNRVYPLGKVAKQLLNGDEDSIFSFYSCLPLLFTRPPQA